ncbi:MULTISPECIES: FecR family protein [Niastella]|uniref:FecR domain-containing protein n=1 Tax=Niastella soli TaxID=2821487 RepID=A0ABS3YXI4_9BACT|nr:FecR family protein [Niastella soli]MBO9202627.1 FecR domain-containing protein [Niastella soli]
MKDFRLYDISDFVIDEDFIRWVHEQREEDNLFWNTWLQQHPDKHLVVATARRVVESIQFPQSNINEAQVEQEVSRLMNTITTQQMRQEPEKGKVAGFKWWYAAAALLLCVTGTWYFYTRDTSVPPYAYASMVAAKQLIEHTNTSQNPLILRLPDGSQVTLAAKSRISYAHTFGSADTARNGASRDVYLLGEAFFEVTKNPHRPFRVFANEIVTKVLGTSFNVRSFEKDTTIQVTVRTGKVSVYAQANTQASAKMSEIILTPNQQLVFERTRQKFQKVLLNNPIMIVSPAIERTMIYDDAPIDKVFGDLSKVYGINIVFDSDLLKKCTVTADLSNEPFYQKLSLICSAIDAHYELIDGQVVIESTGCK